MKAGIVGCGVAGMAAAIALARKGHDVTLFEAFDTPRPLGSGLLLQPSGLAALRVLGLEDAVRETGARIERLEGRDLAGRIVLDLDYRYWRDGGHGVGVHRGRLFDLLFGTLAEAGVELITGARIEAVEDLDHPVFKDATGAIRGRFDLAVIADGSASGLRAKIRPNARAPVYPWGAVWANCRDEAGRFDGALRQVYHRAEVMIGVLPIGRGEVSLFWSLPVEAMDDFFAGDFTAWKTRVSELWPQTAPLLAGLSGHDDLARAQYRDVSIGRWNEGACVVIGDAAHGTSPQLGQGANIALVDAVELAERIGAAPPVTRALVGYQSARRRHASLYQLASRALTPMFQSSGWFWPMVRDRLFVPVSRLPGVRRLAASILVGTARLGTTPRVLRP